MVLHHCYCPHYIKQWICSLHFLLLSVFSSLFPTQLVEANDLPPWTWFCSRLLTIKGCFMGLAGLCFLFLMLYVNIKSHETAMLWICTLNKGELAWLLYQMIEGNSSRAHIPQHCPKRHTPYYRIKESLEMVRLPLIHNWTKGQAEQRGVWGPLFLPDTRAVNFWR